MRATSLRAQLTRAAVLTMLMATSLSAGALLVYELLTYRNFWANELHTQADLLSRATAAALVFNDPQVAGENLALLKSRPAISAAAIYGRDGALVATYRLTVDEALAARAEASSEPGVARFKGSLIEMVYSIEHKGEMVGTLLLRAQHDIWSRLIGYAVILGVIDAASLALSYFLFDSLQRRVTTPLTNIAEVAQEVITSRNWALRAPQTEYQDIRVLVEAFNGMLTECGARTSELEREMVIREKAERDLRLADRRKDEFLATLAHELRNPLAPMAHAVSLMEMPNATPEIRSKALLVLDRQLIHMVRLIDDSLDASRIATGKLSLVRRPVEVVALVRAATELAEPLTRQNDLTLAVRPPDEPLNVNGDAVRLSQVFSNLLNNASRYTPAGGAVTVTARQDGTHVEVSVRDTGIGVAPEMQERIFDLFEQANKSLERGIAGLGIGLTLTRQLLQLHGGTVSMSSAGLGMCSCFTVRLPLMETITVASSDALREADAPCCTLHPGR